MKRVAIIGNALLAADHSRLVDESDFVVRFNEAGNYNRNSGLRVDALCVTNLCDPGRRFAKLRPLMALPCIGQTREIWFPRPSTCFPVQFWFKPLGRNVFKRANYGRHILSRNRLQHKKVVWFTPTLYAAACRDLNLPADHVNGRAPSSGFLAIKYVLERFPSPEFQTVLLGFSFHGSDAHDWPGEEKAVRTLQHMHLLQWM
jgi:hypothetical protein